MCLLLLVGLHQANSSLSRLGQVLIVWGVCRLCVLLCMRLLLLKTFRRVWVYARAYPGLCLGTFAAAIGSTLAGLVFPKVTGWVVDNVLVPKRADLLLPYVLVVHPTLPARNVKELVQIAKQRPGALVYGSPGIATGIHLASEFFALNVGVQLTHIPYKGGAPAMVDLAAGNIALMFSTFSTAGQHLTSGRLRALAVADGVRNKVYATVPTMSEAGFAGLEATTWHGMVARAGVPRAIVMRINSEIARIVETDDVKKAFAATGLDLAVGTADEFDAYIRSEYVKWEKVARVAKIVTD